MSVYFILGCGLYEIEKGEKGDESGTAFSGSLSSSAMFKGDEKILFDEVLTNEGEGYDPSTGEFTVPVSGKYIVSVTIRAQFHKQVSAEIICNDKIVGKITAGYGAIDKASSSMTVALEVRRYDVIYVKQVAGKIGEYHGNGFTTFSCTLFD